jgi:replicative DNA helicase
VATAEGIGVTGVMDHQPPQDLAAERAVLGAMMRSADAVADVAELLDDAELYQPAHQAIYRAILAVHRDGIVPDPVAVSDKLAQRGELTHTGGDKYLLDLYAGVNIARNAEYYAEIISGKASLRRLAAAAQRITHLAHSGAGGAELDEVLDQARAAVDAATAGYRNRRHDEGTNIGDLALAALDRYAQPQPPGLATGWADLDDMLSGGIRPGNLAVVGARPSIGKSVLGINLAVTAARTGTGALFASLEMHRDEVMDRIFASLAAIELDNLTSHKLSDDDWARVQYWAVQLQEVPLRIEDTPELSLARLRALARDRTRHPAGLGLVVADYLQLMRPTDSRAHRQEQVAELSRGLKLLAKELAVPVVALAQLNRKVEDRADKRPGLSDLRESGAIEQDSDIVMLMWDDPDRVGERQVNVAKNRQGRTGDVRLSWSPHYARMRSLHAL